MGVAGESAPVFRPATQGELQRFLAENAAGPRQPLTPVGGRTALAYGYPVSEESLVIDTTDLKQVIEFPVRDMTITVEAGIRVDELTEILGREGQRLPIDIAQSNRATLGGALMTNTSGPRRFGYGTFRDYVIGLTAIDAVGTVFHGGGRVVKNVAGYDLCKLLVGSLGTLAIVTQITLKLRPVSESSLLTWATFHDWDELDTVLECLTTSETRPVAVDVLAPAAASEIAGEVGIEATDQPTLCVGFEGLAEDVDWQCTRFREEIESFRPARVESIRDALACRLWTALTEYGLLTDSPLTFQACVRPSRVVEFLECAERAGVTVAAHAADGVIRGHFSDRLSARETVSELLSQLRNIARTHDGHVTILDCDPGWKEHLPVFEFPPATRRLMCSVKATLDPDNLLNRHRMFELAGEENG